MFKPIRTLLLVLFAFVAGIFFERAGQRETCIAVGGLYDQGLCREGRE